MLARSNNYLIALVGFALLVTGCSDDPIYVHESVPATRAGSLPGVVQDSTPKYRMVTAIAYHDDSTWFFKMSGPIENVGGMQSKWGEFMGTVRFEGDRPTWTEPEGWKSEGVQERDLGGGMKMLSGKVDTNDSEVAVSVSSLGGRQELLSNVNRWRGQLGLPNITESELELYEIKTESGVFKVFDAQGPTLSTRMGGGRRPPFAGGTGAATMPGNHPPIESRGTVPHSSSPEKNSEIKFEAPDGWTSGKTSSMVVGRFSSETEQGSLQLMVMTMRATEEAWKMNLVAWGNQLNLSEEPDVPSITEAMKIADKPAKQARLDGDNPNAEENQSVVAVLVQHKPENGFVIKFSGSQAAVDANQSVLDEFLKSISFEN